MSLTKADMDIAGDYARLCTDAEVGQRCHGMLVAEYEQTVAEVLAVSGRAALLDDNPVLQISLARRRPYLDPLNHIQTVAIRRHRAAAGSEWLDPVLRSINAIAAGMRNTG